MMYIFFLANIDRKISTAPSAKLLILELACFWWFWYYTSLKIVIMIIIIIIITEYFFFMHCQQG